MSVLDVLCARALQQQPRSRRLAAGTAGAAPAADVAANADPGARAEPLAVSVRRAVTVNKPVDEVYRFWRQYENLPRCMRHLESVVMHGDGTSTWTATGPAGMRVSWDAETTADRENEWIAWRSLEGADVDHRGSVRFQRAPGDRGTEVRVHLEYTPPAGVVGRSVAWLFGEEPAQQIREDLRRVKALLETGQVPLSDGPGLWRAAQPPRDVAELAALAGVERGASAGVL